LAAADALAGVSLEAEFLRRLQLILDGIDKAVRS
jgi:hypothetical protein